MISKKKDFSDLRRRISSGAAFGVFAISTIFFGGLIASSFFGLCLAVLTWELFYIFSKGDLNISFFSIIVPIFLFFVPILNFYNFYPVVLIFFCALSSLFFNQHNILSFFCILYIGVSVLIFHEILLSESVNLGKFFKVDSMNLSFSNFAYTDLIRSPKAETD